MFVLRAHLGLGGFKVCVGKTLRHSIVEIFRHLEAASKPINSIIEGGFSTEWTISDMPIVAFCAVLQGYRYPCQHEKCNEGRNKTEIAEKYWKTAFPINVSALHLFWRHPTTFQYFMESYESDFPAVIIISILFEKKIQYLGEASPSENDEICYLPYKIVKTRIDITKMCTLMFLREAPL